MARTSASLLVLLAAASVAAAQQRQPGDPIPLTVSPAAPTAPALQYRLLPEGRDLVPGNAAALYYRSLTVFAQNPSLLDELNGAQWETWLNQPLGQLPLDEVGTRLEAFRGVLGDLDEAARRRQCDWQLSDRPEGIALIIPEIQKCRRVALVVAVRARYRLARRQFAEAMQALRTGYAFARNIGSGPFLIYALVGAAITNILDEVLEELVAQPGAPNLYWALAVLPRPFFDVRTALEQEETAAERTWPGLRHLEDGPLTPKQVRELKEGFARIYRQFGFVEPTALDYVATAWERAAAVPEARKALLADGMTAKQIDAMPAYQVVALYCLRAYRRAWDDYAKWVRLPDFDHYRGFQQARDRLHNVSIRMERLVLNPKGVLTQGGFLGGPGFEKVYAAIGRTDRRFAALACVEAIRLYAAGHGGKLPASLKDITDVPVPLDPVTNRPFNYEAKGDTARLAASLRDGVKTPQFERLRYDLTLRH
jgi:hypothetical protein